MQEKLSKNAINLIADKLRAALNARTDTELAEILGVKQNTVSTWRSRGSIDYAAIIANSDGIDLNWLFDENDKSLIPASKEKFQTKTTKKVNNPNVNEIVNPNVNKPKLQERLTNISAETTDINVFKLRTDRLVERQVIPIYDMEAVAGLVSLFTSDYSQSVVEIMETTLIPKCDGGLRIVGDSMYPLLKSGDVVFYKQVNDLRNSIMIWGEMYLVSFENDGEEYISVKYLQKSEVPDHVTLVSYNQHHKPLDVHMGRIRALALIKASLRLNSIK